MIQETTQVGDRLWAFVHPSRFNNPDVCPVVEVVLVGIHHSKEIDLDGQKEQINYRIELGLERTMANKSELFHTREEAEKYAVERLTESVEKLRKTLLAREVVLARIIAGRCEQED